MAEADSIRLSARAKDLTGQRFGHQVVVSYAEKRGAATYWHVRCDCGNERIVLGASLIAGRSTRCRNNCPASTARIDESGNVYNRLTVLEYAGNTRAGDSIWLCRCECGTLTKVARGELRKGSTKSCGCLRARSDGKCTSTEYITWKEMKRRCYNPKNSQYHLYGGRGITICERWRTSFVDFLADMGPKPFPEATIDRIDNDHGNYEPGSCRWATRLEQGQNTRKVRLLTYNGETLCLRAWARKLGITHRTLSERIARGWSLDRVFAPSEHC